MGSTTLAFVATLSHFDRRISRRGQELKTQYAAAIVSKNGDGKPQGTSIDCLSKRELKLVTVLYPLTAAICAGWVGAPDSNRACSHRPRPLRLRLEALGLPPPSTLRLQPRPPSRIAPAMAVERALSDLVYPIALAPRSLRC